MRVTEVGYTRVRSDGRFGNHQASARAELAQGEDPAAALRELRALTCRAAYCIPWRQLPLPGVAGAGEDQDLEAPGDGDGDDLEGVPFAGAEGVDEHASAGGHDDEDLPFDDDEDPDDSPGDGDDCGPLGPEDEYFGGLVELELLEVDGG